jgi:AcrR family transcriptional regulator
MAYAEADDAQSSESQTLEPRALPRQRRAIERRRAILQAAHALLADHTIDALTTSLIAQRAAVPVASVYAYFPNKMAVFAELAREAMAEVDALLAALNPAGTDAPSIERAVDRAIDIVLAGYNEMPARQQLFSSIRGNATLEPILRESDNRMIDVLATNIETIRPDLPKLRARAIAQTTVATFTALQDNIVSCQDEAYAKTLIAEWRLIVKGYLAVLAVE